MTNSLSCLTLSSRGGIRQRGENDLKENQKRSISIFKINLRLPFAPIIVEWEVTQPKMVPPLLLSNWRKCLAGQAGQWLHHNDDVVLSEELKAEELPRGGRCSESRACGWVISVSWFSRHCNEWELQGETAFRTVWANFQWAIVCLWLEESITQRFQ